MLSLNQNFPRAVTTDVITSKLKDWHGQDT